MYNLCDMETIYLSVKNLKNIQRNYISHARNILLWSQMLPWFLLCHFPQEETYQTVLNADVRLVLVVLYAETSKKTHLPINNVHELTTTMNALHLDN